MASAGISCFLELYDCPPELLNDAAFIERALREAVRRARATLLKQITHRFEPQGVTALGLLAESHISIHTWPELGYAAADVFTCGDRAMPERACAYLARALRARRHRMQRVTRGAELDVATPLEETAAPVARTA